MPRKRPLRTKHTNNRPPLLLSTIAPQDINLREGETRSIVCPDCRSWRRLMGETRLVIREHCHSDRVAEGETHERCPGSRQLVILDQDVAQWGESVLAADSTATGRRSARQHHKPQPAPARAVSHIAAGRQPVGRGRWILREMAWASADVDVRETDARRVVPAGDAPTEGRAVPLVPQDVTAHDRRQADLGKRYARKATSTV
ncbi:hypothetical protein ACH47C_23540 [Streptomyces rishiriensis]|uniref:hypothetical protein n=1 Tax=Streptomyces rishiriensis TaxID=68264 RepID=UPI0033DF8CF2